MGRGFKEGMGIAGLFLFFLFFSSCGPVGGPVGSQATGNWPILKAVVPLSSKSIRIEWEDRSRGEEGFRVERRTGTAQGVFQMRAIVGPDVVSFEDTGLATGTTYYYRVSYFIGDENSKPSNAESAQTF